MAKSISNDERCLYCLESEDNRDGSHVLWVQCDECSKWSHQSCAGVTGGIDAVKWSCGPCILAAAQSADQSTFKTPCRKVDQVSGENNLQAGRALRLETKSVVSVSHKGSSIKARNKLQLEIELLEQKKKLEQEFLEKKHNLLREINEIDSEVELDESLEELKEKRTERWATSTNNYVGEPKANENKYEAGTTERTKEAQIQLTLPQQQCVQTQQQCVQTQQQCVQTQQQWLLPQQRGAPPLQQCAPPQQPGALPLPQCAPPQQQWALPQGAPPQQQWALPQYAAPQQQWTLPQPYALPQQQWASSPVTTAHTYNARCVMPRELPTFSGKPEEWPLFYSNFQNSTRLCGFSNDENLLRLQRALKGKAFDSVSSKLLVPDLVPEIMETLRMLFGRPDHIINKGIAKLRAQPNVNGNKLETLIAMALELKNLTAIMTATGLEVYGNNPMLVQEMIEKLPAYMRMSWADHQRTTNNNNDLKSLSEWLYTQAESASSVVSSYGETNNQPKVQRVNFHKEEKSKEAGNRALGCYYCSESHSLAVCPGFKSLKHDEKWSHVKSLKLCFCCLKKHDWKLCKNRKECQIDGCNKKHHILLHKREATPPKTRDDSLSAQHEEEINDPVVAAHHQVTSSMLYRLVPVTVYGKNGSCNIHAFCDDGSGPTMIEEELADKLCLNGPTTDLCLRWTNGTRRVERDSKIVSLQISPKGNKKNMFDLNNVRTVKALNLPKQTMDVAELCKRYKHLRGLPIESYKNVRPQMIIGLSNRSVVMPLKYREGRPNEPAATKTRLGWTVFGTVDERVFSLKESLQLHVCECNKDIELQSLVTNMWKIEEAGIENTLQTNTGNQDIKMKNAVVRNADRFVVKLLWKSENIILQDNYTMALQRLKCFEKKLLREPDLKKYVNDHIESMVKKGYARKLSPGEIAAAHARKWYLPIFTVRNPNKPNKVRLVWDAAARYNNTSLNDYLEKGPSMLNSLIGVLFNFRIGRYGVCGDICEMFHRIQVDTEDQQAQRFLWRDSEKLIPDVYVLCVLSFGASCSPALAQFVRNQNALDFTDEFPRATKCIVERHYVDDMLDSVDTEEEAVKLAMDVRHVHQKGNFVIRNWLTNSKAVAIAVGDCGEPQTFCSAGKRMDQVIEPAKVLGMWWETGNDMFCFNLKFTKADKEILEGIKLPTKRQLLRLTMSIFDPLGFLTFYMVDMKILFQQIWRSGIGWDDEITPEHARTWRKWLSVLPDVERLNIPRHYFRPWKCNDCVVELHIFVDASLSAFAAVGYFRIENESNVTVAFVSSKSKVAPLKPISVPRMELMAAVLGARLGKMIEKQHDLKIDEVNYWSDSKTVLSWLHSDPVEHKQFVTYRVGEIQDTTDIEKWKFVPTKMNPADLATKAMVKSKLEYSDVWYNGPEFLKKPKELWPKQQKIEITEEELRKPKQTQLVAFQSEVDGTIVDCSRYSKWERLLRSVAYVGRYVHALKNITNQMSVAGSKMHNLTSKELNWSHNLLCKIAQKEAYPAEINKLKVDNNCNMPKNSALYKLSPFLDEEGVLRMRSRLEKAQCVDEPTKNPIILPKNNRIVRLLIDWYHRKYKHVSHEAVLNEMFQKYHIASLRQVLRSVRNACQFCKNRQACPQPPEMAALPNGRVSPFCRPFTHVGMDFFGPFLTTVGRRTEKRYGVLFTCLTCRAIHVEMAHSLTMSSCSMAIRNFIARRGMPGVIYSDNGTNLKAAEKELRESLAKVNFGDLQAEFVSTDTSWEFIPPASPHMGGAWERMVRSIKHVLYQIITPETKLTDERLHNLLLEVENIINSRPLTYLSLDTAEQEVLTPNHFLLGSSNGQKPPGQFNSADQFVRRSWRHSQYLADCFWKRWVAEVLPTLTRRTKWFQKTKPIQVGDVVIIVDPNSPRYSWPKGIIVDTIKANDDQIRSVVVRTAHGTYHRPAAKVAVLDVKSQEDGPVNF